MPRDRILSPEEARSQAQNLYWKMEGLTSTYNAGPRWGGAIFEGNEVIIGAQFHGLTTAPPGERWPLTLRGHIDLNRKLPKQRRFVGDMDVIYRDFAFPPSPTNRKFALTHAHTIQNFDTALRDQENASGFKSTKSLTIEFYGGDQTAREVKKATDPKFAHQTDFYFDSDGNLLILGRRLDRPRTYYLHEAVLWRHEATALPFSARLAEVANTTLDDLQQRLNKAQDILRTEEAKKLQLKVYELLGAKNFDR